MEAAVAAIVAFFVGFFAHGASLSYASLPLPHMAQQTVRVMFVGDMMFDRTIRSTIDEKGGDYVFSCIDPYFSQADLVVGNLEGPITDNPTRSLGSVIASPDNFTFTFPPATAALLYKHNVRMVSIGNNHIYNFGLPGVTSTEAYLDAAGVSHFGDPDKLESDRVARTSLDGIPFSFVNWSDWTSDKTDHTVAQVRAEAQAGRVVVVYTHWGIEYATTSPARVHELAHQFVDAGASLVVGSHPHVVEEHEIYNGVNIYYSLGNFIFDQYWNDAVDHGLMLDVTFDKSGVERVDELPVVLQHDRRTCPVVSSSSPFLTK